MKLEGTVFSKQKFLHTQSDVLCQEGNVFSGLQT